MPQSSSSGLADVSTIFTSFIHGENSNLTVVGDSAGPSDVIPHLVLPASLLTKCQVTWLNDGIKSLRIATVLPSQGPLTVITAIDLNELELLFTDDTAYDPATSSNDATAAFTIPFAFPIDIIALEQNITAGFDGQSFAELIIPKGPSTTDVSNRIIHLTFNGTPFSVFDDEHSVFQQFLASVTISSTQELILSGSADTDAETAVGLLSLTGITFNVTTTIAGLQGLNTKPTVVSDLDVNQGFSDFLLIKVTTALFNPRLAVAS